MDIIPEKLGLITSVSPEEPLPIKYTEKITDPNLILGRIVGLMAHISKRTVQPISYGYEVLKQEDNQSSHSILEQAYNRISSTITKDEERVLEAILNEYKWLEENYPFEFSKQPLMAMSFSVGWKMLVDDMFDQGGNKYDLLVFDDMFDQGGNKYDLLVFTDHVFLKSSTDPTLVYGYMGKIPERSEYHLRIFKEEDGREGLKYAKRGTIVFKAIYDVVDVSGFFERGWFLRKEGKWGAVNERGEWMLATEFESIRTEFMAGFRIKKNGKWGYCNKEGEFVLDFIYDEIYVPLKDKTSCEVGLNGKWGYFDDKGKEIIPIQYDRIDVSDTKGLIWLKKDKLYKCFDTTVNSTIREGIEKFKDFERDHPNEACVQINGKCGVIDRKGNFILEPVYDNIEIDEPYVYRVIKNGVMGKINKDKEILFPFKYKSLSPFNKEGIAVVQNNIGLYGYIDMEDNVILDFMFREAENFEGDYAKVSEEYGKFGVIDKTGKIVVPLIYDNVRIESSDIITVAVRDTWGPWRKGCYDLKTGFNLPCIYKEVIPIYRNLNGIYLCRCKVFDNDTVFEIEVGPKVSSGED